MAATTHEKCSPDVFPFKCEYGLKAPALLYMSINDIAVKDVSRGKLARFVGMTKTGSKVLFTTTEPLLPQDHDTSADMYMWSEEGDSLTLLSQQGNLGNGDNCSATWIEKCGVEADVPVAGRRLGSASMTQRAFPAWMTRSPTKTATSTSIRPRIWCRAKWEPTGSATSTCITKDTCSWSPPSNRARRSTG